MSDLSELPEIVMDFFSSMISPCIGLLKYICRVFSSPTPKFNMQGISSSGIEQVMLFCSAGVPPRGSIDGPHVESLDSGFDASLRSSDQPPSALNGSELYQLSVYSTKEIELFCLFFSVKILPLLLKKHLVPANLILL